MKIVKYIKKLIPSKIKRILKYSIPKYGNVSFSQEGEDIILSRIFEGKKEGFYIDIGAHHPSRFSNTMYFYKKGWRGINIDAMPGSMAAFDIERPEDINLEIPVSDKKEELTYFIFNEPALNTFSESLAIEYEKDKYYHIILKKEMLTNTLESILDEHLTSDQKIDFLTIDVEGLDLNVIKSNNWKKYLPQIVLVEIYGSDIQNLLKNSIYIEMDRLGYTFIAKTINTAFFQLRIRSK
jgi:FkbM family methyltransferase